MMVGLAATAMAAAVTPVLSQQNTQTIARYTMDAGTLSGMAAMTQGGQGGGLGGIMNMMRGGGGGVAHELTLRLGSTQSAQGSPAADHFMPQGAGLGASVPLVTPSRRTGQSDDDSEPGMPGNAEMPRGRLLLFWGCGERAGAGQPVVIDFARMARGEIPPGLFAQGLDLPEDWQVMVSNSTTYGDWPNSRSTASLTAQSSLLGAHRVVGNYSPEISFNLAEDFMPGLNPAGIDLASGATRMRWNHLDKATGYYAWSIGAGQNNGDMVWWTSSSSQSFGGPFADWISPAAARSYVEAGQLMEPGTTECVIPAEARAAGGQAMMTSLYAYGPQVNFTYPERPQNAPASWRPEWIARVRFRSMAMMIPGMEAMMGGRDTTGRQSRQADPAPAEPAGLPRCRGGLRGIAERAAGLCQ
ncbi:hypothetical protein M3P36_06310 [Altererythrobacter sp. KTW20L]|uniref:hypothetical protein n=1 Tax=Altererythrobacter sp. KTW20L TaxID=2942210 RepID=UPI0020BDF82C|nr:hypothetical protein [Altererythrobacter sp. KTW20L]MCL6250657.1 hypothetical protein [Altererythrobacter sp. KTW20L]